jgi:hypothetical protein
MKNPKTKAMINYSYSVGDAVVHGSTSSNYVEPFIRDVVISIKKECSTKYFKPGDILTYNLVVANIGTYFAEFINISEQIQNQTIIVDSISVSSLKDIDFAYQDAIKGIDFIISNLAPNDTVYISYQTVVDEILDPNFNIVSVSEIEVDDNNIIYSNPVEIVQKYARIICEVETSPYIYYNKPYQYNITVTNVGNSEANDVELSTQLPEEYELDHITIDEENCDSTSLNNNILKFTIGNISANETKLISVSGKIKKQ